MNLPAYVFGPQVRFIAPATQHHHQECPKSKQVDHAQQLTLGLFAQALEESFDSVDDAALRVLNVAPTALQLSLLGAILALGLGLLPWALAQALRIACE